MFKIIKGWLQEANVKKQVKKEADEEAKKKAFELYKIRMQQIAEKKAIEKAEVDAVADSMTPLERIKENIGLAKIVAKRGIDKGKIITEKVKEWDEKE